MGIFDIFGLVDSVSDKPKKAVEVNKMEQDLNEFKRQNSMFMYYFDEFNKVESKCEKLHMEMYGCNTKFYNNCAKLMYNTIPTDDLCNMTSFRNRMQELCDYYSCLYDELWMEKFEKTSGLSYKKINKIPSKAIKGNLVNSEVTCVEVDESQTNDFVGRIKIKFESDTKCDYHLGCNSMLDMHKIHVIYKGFRFTYVEGGVHSQSSSGGFVKYRMGTVTYDVFKAPQTVDNSETNNK